MDQLISLTQNSSVLSIDLFPTIVLENNSQYAIGLYSLNTYNTIPNIEKDKNDELLYHIMTYKEGKYHENVPYSIKIPEGVYEIEDLSKYIREQLVKFEITKTSNVFSSLEDNLKLNNEEIDKLLGFQLKANLNTLKVDFRFPYDVQLSKNSFLNLLGFDCSKDAHGKVRILGANGLHSSNMSVNIFPISHIDVECNLTETSYRNGRKSHTIFTFYPNVPHGFKISISPSNILYLPVNVREISNITLRLVDQNGQLVNFKNEEISIQLNLRKIT